MTKEHSHFWSDRLTWAGFRS